jgi:GTP cyclohydrolase III
MGYYYAFDGDDIGAMIELIMFNGNVDMLPNYSNTVTKALALLNKRMEKLGCKTLFCAGDSLLCYSERLIADTSIPLTMNDIKFSLGIGNNPGNSILALKKAKGTGKNKIEILIA